MYKCWYVRTCGLYRTCLCVQHWILQEFHGKTDSNCLPQKAEHNNYHIKTVFKSNVCHSAVDAAQHPATAACEHVCVGAHVCNFNLLNCGGRTFPVIPGWVAKLSGSPVAAFYSLSQRYFGRKSPWMLAWCNFLSPGNMASNAYLTSVLRCLLFRHLNGHTQYALWGKRLLCAACD